MEPTPADLALFARCFDDNGMPRSPALVSWAFGANPTGKLWVDFALAPASEPQKLAAIYAVLPVRVRLGGKVQLAAQSVDTVTDQGFRGRGLFLELASSCYARAAAEGATHVFGFPNGDSAHGFFNKLGWTKLDPVPFLIRPLRTRYVAERLKLARVSRWMPDVRIPVLGARLAAGQTIAPLSDWHDAAAVWHEFSRDVGMAVERDAAYLRWRFARPDAKYRAIGLSEGGDLLAFGVHRVAEKHGGRVGYVMELVHRPGREAAASTLLASMLKAMQQEGADVALAWNLEHSPNHRAFRRAGFVPFPERLRPIELHFGSKALGRTSATPPARSDWYLSYCDSDTV
jgi:GNAT superfamily N-acetyltransferase